MMGEEMVHYILWIIPFLVFFKLKGRAITPHYHREEQKELLVIIYVHHKVV